MNLLLCLKRPFIWLSRFRYRCGYGVHSPFAFSLITDVIYEKMPYYAYFSLKEEQKKMIKEQGYYYRGGAAFHIFSVSAVGQTHCRVSFCSRPVGVVSGCWCSG